MSDLNEESGYTDQGRKVAGHWSNLAVTYAGALKSLEAKGIAADEVKVEDLHALDMIHMGGLAATDILAKFAGVTSASRVLDVGCGVGGPARRVASKFGASVWGVELSETLYQTAVKFTELVALQNQVKFKQGSALSLPFGDDMFDILIMQHVAMQISEKNQLFKELSRVMTQGGRLAMHEIFAGEGDLYYPLPWATEPSMSALEPFPECSERLSAIGFNVGEFVDHSEDGRKFHEVTIEKFDAALNQNKGAQGLSTEAIRARRAASVAMEKNLRTGSLRVGMMVARKGK